MRQTGNDNLIWHLSCQQDDQIWQIEMKMHENCEFLHNWHLKINFLIFNVQKVYSIGLWICLPWDFCPSSWDHEIVLKTVRSALGWGEGCPMLWQIYAWHCIVMKILHKSIRIKNKRYNEKLTKPCISLSECWTSIGGWGVGGAGGCGYVCSSSSSSSSILIYTRNRIILHGLPRNRV